MKLYKNVDICDLKSILEKGILSIDESGNDNWSDSKRANNPTDRVYLFQPVAGKSNSFPQSYGVALLEVEVEDVTKSEMLEMDVHKDDYIEYSAKKVTPDQIKAIYVPAIFQKKLQGIDEYPDDLKGYYHVRENGLDENTMQRVTWCGMTAHCYTDDGYVPADEKVLERFAKTASIECSCDDSFFRGCAVQGEVFNLYDVMYII